jgi:hypothetical protein
MALTKSGGAGQTVCQCRSNERYSDQDIDQNIDQNTNQDIDQAAMAVLASRAPLA